MIVVVQSRLPRWAALATWVLGAAAAHYALPYVVAHRDSRRRNRRRRLSNAGGVLLVGAGTYGLGWCIAQHYQGSTDKSYRVSLVPEYLLRTGPYAYSRNPMYVSELLIWLGWSELFGSPALLGATVALALGMHQAVAREEKTLMNEFGSSWEAYVREVPRWV